MAQGAARDWVAEDLAEVVEPDELGRVDRAAVPFREREPAAGGDWHEVECEEEEDARNRDQPGYAAEPAAPASHACVPPPPRRAGSWRVGGRGQGGQLM